jgi:2'-5' RNA ligase
VKLKPAGSRDIKEMKRIFVAIEVEAGGEMQRITATLKALLGNENIKWVDIRNMHVTLAFLGDTEEDRIKSLAGVIKEKCAGFGDFEVTISGTGVFRNFRDPRIIWAGINPQEELIRLGELVKNALRQEGFHIDDKPFRPHITLGRIKNIKDNQNLKQVLDKYSKAEPQTVSVKEVILFESILKQTGPVYRPLANFSLNQNL